MNERGTSLVELMVVVVIIAIMGTFAYASIDKTSMRHNEAASNLLSAIQLGKANAVKTNTSAFIGMNASGWVVSDGTNILRQSDPLAPKLSYTGNAPSGAINGVAYSHVVEINSRALKETPIPAHASNAAYFNVVRDNSPEIDTVIACRISVAGGAKLLDKQLVTAPLP